MNCAGLENYSFDDVYNDEKTDEGKLLVKHERQKMRNSTAYGLLSSSPLNSTTTDTENASAKAQPSINQRKQSIEVS